jgi:hypothetical protein
LFTPQSLSSSIRSTKVDGNCAKYRTPIHHGIKQAFLIAFGKIDPVYIIENVSLEDLLTITRPAKYKRFPSESWLNISPKVFLEKMLLTTEYSLVLTFVLFHCTVR